MNTKIFLSAFAIIVALGLVVATTSAFAQNMTGGNMTGDNATTATADGEDNGSDDDGNDDDGNDDENEDEGEGGSN